MPAALPSFRAIAATALSAFLLLLLSGCDRGPAPAAGAGSPDLPTHQAEELTGFVLAEATSEPWNGSPSLLLRFSRPLASAQDFGKLIRVRTVEGAEVEGGYTLFEGDPRRLYFPNVEAGKSYQIDIDATLVSEQGDTLGAQTVKVEAVAAPPLLGFASQGDLLPVKNAGGLPVVSVNVAEVDLEFLRVRPHEIARFVLDHATRGRPGGWELEQLMRLADSVYAARFAIARRPNERTVSHLPVADIAELRMPGLYIAVMKRSGDFDWSAHEVGWFVVSDIGVHARLYQDKTEVLLRSLDTGAPLCKVAVRVVDRYGERVAGGTSDCEGRYTLDFVPKAGHLLIAGDEQQIALLPFNQPALDLSEYPVTGLQADQISVFTWSGRDLYRPGETLRVSALLRDPDGRVLPAGQPLFAELRKPDGSVYATQQLEPGELGHFRYERVLPSDVPTGRWTFAVASSPDPAARRHEWKFRVEEFLPERMKLELGAAQETLAPGEALALSIEGRYLYGAPAGGNRVGVKLNVVAKPELFPALKGWFFGDGLNLPKVEPVEQELTLDEAGKGTASLPVNYEPALAPVAAQAVVSLYESGGRAVNRVLERIVWPAPQVLGVRPLFDGGESDPNQSVGFEIARYGQDGQAVAGRAELKLLREQRDYRWEYRDGRWHADYSAREVEIVSQSLTLDGKAVARVNLPVEWGTYRLELTDPDTGLVTRYPFVAGWSWNDGNTGTAPRPDKIKLALDAPRYKPGQQATITITAPHAGTGVLLVEADQLLLTLPFEATPTAEVTFTVDPEWKRHDIYLSALVFRPGSAAEKITPSRALGMAWLPLDREDRKVEVKLVSPEKMQPRETLTATVEAPALAGQEAWVAVNAVDAGVVSITRYPVPDAFAHFFSQRRFAIEAWDVYARLIEVLAGDAMKLRYGGDDALPGLAQARRPPADVEIVDLHSGSVRFDAAGKATVALKVPDFNGALRVSALAWSDHRYGHASTETIVRAPIVVEPSTPRALAPGDRSTLTVDVQSFLPEAREVVVTVSSTAPLVVSGEQRFSLAPEAKRTLSFPLSAAPDLGRGRYTLTVSAGDVRFERSYGVVVRPINPGERRVTYTEVSDPAQIAIAPDISGWLPGSVRARVALSNSVPLPLSAVADDLLTYPYGCIEQTTSSTWPWILIDEPMQQRLGLKLPKDADRKTQADLGLNRVASMALPDGHFAYWPGSTDHSDPALTPYVADFLLDARDAGFTVPGNVLDKTLERIQQDLLAGGALDWSRHWGDRGDHARFAYSAYAGWVLSRMQKAPLGTLRSLWDNDRAKARNGLSLLRLGLALKAAGDAKRGEEAIALALGEKYQRADVWLGDYGSNISDHATMLALIIADRGVDAPTLSKLLALANQLRGRNYTSTTEQIAILKLGRAVGLKTRERLPGTLVVGDNREDFDVAGLFSRDLVIEDLRAGASLTSSTKGPLFLYIDAVGVPTTAPTPVSNGVSVLRRYYRPNGVLYDGSPLAEGDTLIAVVDVRAQGEFEDGLIVDLLPAGLEIENPNLLDARALENLKVGTEALSDIRSNASPIHEEFREDRYVAAIKLDGSNHRAAYVVRAVSPGTYQVPPPIAEHMYRPDVRAIGEAVPARIEVRGR